jgi:hypothetical protein
MDGLSAALAALVGRLSSQSDGAEGFSLDEPQPLGEDDGETGFRAMPQRQPIAYGASVKLV